MSTEVYDSAIQFLSRREHSREELIRKLQLKYPSVESTDIHDIVASLQAKDWQSDLRYAENLIRTRIHAGYGWQYIRQELQQQGVSDDMIRNALDNVAPDWIELAQQAYRKKYHDKPIQDFNDKQKRIAFLSRKGFSFDEIKHVLASC